jgi:large subunit ribosomal protein L15
MDLHSMKNQAGRNRRKRVGRGESSGTGKTAGRGHKGQGARAGSGYKPTFEGGQMPLIRRLPKFGFKNINRKEYHPINISDLERFEDGAPVGPEELREAGLYKGTIPRVKILGRGELTRKLTVSAHGFSESAKSKIEAVGGEVHILP